MTYLPSWPTHSGLHQSLAHLELLRSLCTTQILNISHNEHFMKRRIQRRNRISQGRAKLRALQGFRWSIAPIREILRIIVAFLILRLLVDGVVQKLVILAALPARLIYSYLDEPRAELGISPEGMQVYKGLEKRLLRRFLCVRFILQY